MTRVKEDQEEQEKGMTRTDYAIVTTYIQSWELYHDVPATTPGPDSLDVMGSEDEGIQHQQRTKDEARVVDACIREQAKAEKVDTTWMSKLLIHVYRDGLPIRAFRLWTDPAHQNIPLGLVALGFDSETIVHLRLERFYDRLLSRIDEHIRIAS